MCENSGLRIVPDNHFEVKTLKFRKFFLKNSIRRTNIKVAK